MDPETIAAAKALSDATRLRIAGRLATGAASAERLAADLGLGLPVVVRHVGLMRRAGLVESASTGPGAVVSLRVDALQAIGRQLDELDRGGPRVLPDGGPGGESLPAWDARVLRSFVVDGRLESIPAQERKRAVVLRFLLDRCFAEDRAYPEKEVNQRLALYHPDVASLRRYLVEAGLMTRAGGIYRRAAGAAVEAVDGAADGSSG